MDLAPALPPSQDSVLALVSSDAAIDIPPAPAIHPVTNPAFDEATVQLSLLPESVSELPSLQAASVTAASLQATGLGSIKQTPSLSKPMLPSALMVSIAGVEKASAAASTGFLSTGFLSTDGMSRSFNFVGQAWRAARFNNPVSAQLNQPLYSATVPIQWATDESWRNKVIAADIQVRRVDATAAVAQKENSVWSAALIEQCMPNASRQLQDGVRYKISMGDKTLGYVADEKRAYLLAQQLKRLIRQASFAPENIAAYPVTDAATKHINAYTAKTFVGTPDQPLFFVDETMAESVGYSSDWAAVAWANNLRLALDAAPLKTGEILKGLGNLEDSKITMSGEASWYGPYFHGKITANGETYNQNDLTVAHKSLPFGTQLEVRNVTNDRTVVLRVNDRGPYVGDRILDLSKAAADCLGSDDVGIIPVEATVLKSVK